MFSSYSRPAACRALDATASNLTESDAASVIITYRDEPRSTLLRTIVRTNFPNRVSCSIKV